MTRSELSRRTQNLRAAFQVLLVGAVVAMLVLLSYDAWQGARQREAIETNTALLVECTTDPAERKPAADKPGEDDCYVRSQNRTARAVEQIGDISVIAAACGAAHPGDIPATRKCVERALNEKR